MGTTVGGVTGTTQMAALAPDAQTAIDDALNKLSNFNQIPLAEPGKFVNLNSYFGANQVSQWKQKYADEIKALANKDPPMSAGDIQTAAGKIITRFEMKATFMREMRFMMFQQMMDNMQSLLGDVLNWSPL